MDYILSIKNTNYHMWQTELLIESFKQLNIADKLLICIAENSEPKIGEFCKNIIRHKRKFVHKDYQTEFDCIGANRILSFVGAIQDGYIEPPFTLIHADMLIKKPIADDEYKSDVVFNIGEEYALLERFSSEIKDIFKDKQDKIKDGDSLYQDMPTQMIPTSSITFNTIPKDFHFSLRLNLENIIKNKPKEISKEKAAWILTFAQYVGYASMMGVYRESHLIDAREDTHFIHYKHGIPPVFHKRHYQTGNGFNLSVNPYAAIMEFNPTLNSNIMQNMIRQRNKNE